MRSPSMWKLIKASLSHDRNVFVFLLSVVITAAVLNAFIDGLEDDLARIMFITIPALGTYVGNQSTKYRTTRLGVLLPLPLRQVVMAGHLIWIGYWCSLLVIYVISCLISTRGHLWPGFGWYILGLSATANIFVFGMGILIDIKHCVDDGIAYWLLSPAPLLLVLAAALSHFYIIGECCHNRDSALIRFFISPSGIFILLLAAVITASLYFIVYLRRKSFTE